MHLRIALDVGMGAFKYCSQLHGQKLVGLIDSAVAPPREPGFGQKPFLQVTMSSECRIVGSDARASEFARACWGGGKVSQDVKLLAMAALGKICECLSYDQLHVTLGSSLPVQMWATHRDALAQLLSGEHAFALGKSSYRVRVELDPNRVLPEGYCTYLHLRSLGLLGAHETVGIVDVGHSTVGLCLVENDEFVAERSVHRDEGMRMFYGLLGQEVARMTGDFPGDLMIERLYMSGAGEIRRMNEVIDLQRILQMTMRTYGEKIFNLVPTTWKGVTLGRVVLTGGGATTVLPAFAEHFSRKFGMATERVIEMATEPEPRGLLMVCPEPRMANVRGLYHWLQERSALSVA
ncbi:ParM/StbA family protein [Gloeobacter kilaueensis]|uniref:Plasmid segregation protein ParM n=1 Tax=Gloeobacter kilaueensis (strain ATCC BAA-2537 / CCAP 1431/1 / ULC 316 / JS1) TaxID=1183438 RepID=U5QG76_GLOK1|nr:ParM/StbA family protein [Gloeobacter kilaueensis]AGY57967.1 plasmid segregation protein ParM [Gloeobacter kilaueensis JS1]